MPPSCGNAGYECGFNTDIAFVGTVYNNVDCVDKSLSSLIEVIRMLTELNFEIIIVDNFSSDGTYEELLKVKMKARTLSNLKRFVVTRLKCSRGLGRRIAVRLSKARYIVPIDLDTYYDSDKLGRLIKIIAKSNINKCIVIANPGLHLICPRDIVLKIGNYSDLNCGEDIELLARIFHQNHALSLPVKVVNDLRKYEKRREYRYAKSLVGKITRKATLLRDRYFAYALSLRKIVREHYFVYKNNLVKVFLNTVIWLLCMCIGKFAKSNVFEADKMISNYLYVDLMTYKTMVNPEDFGFKNQEIIEFFKFFQTTEAFTYTLRYAL